MLTFILGLVLFNSLHLVPAFPAFVLVNCGLWAVSQRASGHHGHYFPMLGWGIGLAIHGTVVLMRLKNGDLKGSMLDAEVSELRRRQRTSLQFITRSIV